MTVGGRAEHEQADGAAVPAGPRADAVDDGSSRPSSSDRSVDDAGDPGLTRVGAAGVAGLASTVPVSVSATATAARTLAPDPAPARALTAALTTVSSARALHVAPTFSCGESYATVAGGVHAGHRDDVHEHLAPVRGGPDTDGEERPLARSEARDAPTGVALDEARARCTGEDQPAREPVQTATFLAIPSPMFRTLIVKSTACPARIVWRRKVLTTASTARGSVFTIVQVRVAPAVGGARYGERAPVVNPPTCTAVDRGRVARRHPDLADPHDGRDRNDEMRPVAGRIRTHGRIEREAVRRGRRRSW